MLNFQRYINESSHGQDLIVLRLIDKDEVRKEYYFWSNLSEAELYVTNSKLLSDKLKEILEKKYSKIYKEVMEIIEQSGSRDSKARVYLERIKPNKIKKL